jgi:3-isopropylmalate dehydrogenase
MNIAVLAGDGIGPEIVGQALKVLRTLARDGLKLELEEAPFGGAGYDACGDPLPEATLKLARAADAVLCGAVGGPKYDALPRPQRPEQGILRIRKDLGLFANLRPAVLYPELVGASTLKPEVVSGLDVMIVRELTGDIYFGEQRPAPEGERRARGLRHHALLRARNRAHCGGRLQGGNEAQPETLLGR